MVVLGIETSCDETAASVVIDGRRVLSNIIASQHDLHAEFSGVVPEIASRAHTERITPILERALESAGVTWTDLDGVAVGHRPGLIGSLLVGVAAAKAIAWGLGIPIIGVDHVHAHLYAASLNREDEVPDRALGLVVSGGHTAIYRCHGNDTPVRLGATIDDAIGEAFDKVATILGLPYPGGPAIDRLAREADADERAHEFPISRLSADSLDFSFSGLKTSVLYTVRGRPRPKSAGGGHERDHSDLTDKQRRDVAASFQHAAIRAVLIKLERALEREAGVDCLLAGGGVTANSQLRRGLTEFASSHSIDLRLPAMEYCIDNGAMIAGLGAIKLMDGQQDELDLVPVPTTAC